MPTPVWGARDGERLVFSTEDGSPKLRRLRNQPEVRVARVSEIAERLRLERLATFFDRLAVPSA